MGKLIFFLLYFLSIIYLSIQINDITEDINLMGQDARCENITAPKCLEVGYNRTMMPNLLGHTRQDIAYDQFRSYFIFLKANCSPDFAKFLCFLYFPVCTNVDKILQPCRSLCLSSERGCKNLFEHFSRKWQNSFNCDQFPDDKQDDLCIQTDNSRAISKNILTKREFVCPIQFKVPKEKGYVFRINNKIEQDCGAPCDGILFDSNQRIIIRLSIFSFAITSLVSTTFTVLTYLINYTRFRYPQKSFIFMSSCYIVISIVYITGYIVGDHVACNNPFPPRQSKARMVRTINQGDHGGCTILFLFLYFFTFASQIWWVMINFTWFLAAGLKWSHEAIDNSSHYFQTITWTLSGFIMIMILALRKVEGDVLSGVCYVGLWDKNSQLLFIVVPLLICLVFGSIFLLIGFISSFRIRILIKTDGIETRKLEKLMLKTGCFSALYIVFMLVLLLCYYYEHVNFDFWISAWLQDICKYPEYAIPCPLKNEQISKPDIKIFILKYFAILMPGISSGFWILSEKTKESWADFFRRRLCCFNNERAVDV